MADGLTPEQEQERLRILQEQNEAAKELLSTYEKQKKIKGQLNTDEKNVLDLSQKLLQFSSEIEKSTQKRLDKSTSSKDLSKELLKIEENHLQNKKLIANSQISLNNQYNEALKINSELASRVGRANVYYDRSITLLDQAREKYTSLLQQQTEGNNISRSSLELARQRIKNAEEEVKGYEENLDNLTKQHKEQENIVKSILNTKKAQEEILNQQEQEVELLKKAIVERRKIEVLNELNDKFNVKQLKDIFTLVGLFKLLLDSALNFNRTSVEIGKNLGYGADQADRVTSNLVSMARNSSNINFTLKNAAEAMNELNKATGGVAEYSADTLETQIMLTKQFGLTGDEAAGIYKFSVLTGKSSSQVNKEMVAAFASTRNAVKGSADLRATIAEASKVSGQLAANFKNNPAEITKAVVQAQALGTTLEQTKAQSEKLLNFQSSIESELKAELLTGQQINLERARAFALQGDMVGVMKELANQGMTIDKFNNMNVLAQQAYAEALGLSADQLSDQLRKQKTAQEQGKSLAQITAEEAEEAQKRQNIQDKFNAGIDKLKDLIGNLLSGPFGKLLEGLTKALDLVSFLLSKWYILYPLIGIVALSYLPKIAAGFGGIIGQVDTLRKGITGAFKEEGAVKGFFGKIKEKFTGGLKGDKSKEVAEKGATESEKISTSVDKAKGDNGVGFKTRMRNIAAGIKAFADPKVLGGALVLPVAGIGLLLFTPGVLGAKAIEKIDGDKFKSSMINVAEGIKEFADNVTLAALGKLILTGPALLLFIPGVLGAKIIEIVNGDKFKSSMTGVAKGIKAFDDNATLAALGKLSLAGVALTLFSIGVPGLLLLQLVNGKLIEQALGGVGKGIKTLSDNIDLGKTAKAALGIALLGASLIPAAISFKMFAEVSWEDLAKAGVTLIGLGAAGAILGGMSTQLILGAIGIAALGAALIPASIAFKMFSEVEWGDMAKVGVALLGLGIAGAIFGSLAPLMLLGALAIAALGASLIPLAFALNLAAPGIEAFGKAIKSAFEGLATVITAAANGISTIFTSLQNVDVVKLLAIGPALFGIGAGLAALGGGGAMNAILGFFSGDPIEKLERLSATGDGLIKVSTALQAIATSLSGLSSILSTIDVSKLEALDEFASNRATESAIGGIIGGITNFITAPIKTISETITGGGEGRGGSEEGIKTQSSIDLTPMIAAINDVRSSVDKLKDKKIDIFLDGKKVGSGLYGTSYKSP